MFGWAFKCKSYIWWYIWNEYTRPGPVWTSSARKILEMASVAFSIYGIYFRFKKGMQIPLPTLTKLLCWKWREKPYWSRALVMPLCSACLKNSWKFLRISLTILCSTLPLGQMCIPQVSTAKQWRGLGTEWLLFSVSLIGISLSFRLAALRVTRNGGHVYEFCELQGAYPIGHSIRRTRLVSIYGYLPLKRWGVSIYILDLAHRRNR